MTGRRTITAAMERRIICCMIEDGFVRYTPKDGKWQACLTCGCDCGRPLHLGTPVIHEHMTPLCQGGADDETNIRLVRKECAHRKTYGSKATTAGSDIHKIAKVRRLRGETRGRPRRTWPKGRPITSRPFPKKEQRT